MTGKEFADAVAAHLTMRFADKGLRVYREYKLGRRYDGKERIVDLFCVSGTDEVLVVECKYQQSSGSAEDKLLHVFRDFRSIPFTCLLVYGGTGWSESVAGQLRGNPRAVFWSPTDMKALDQRVAIFMHWIDVLVANKKPFVCGLPMADSGEQLDFSEVLDAESGVSDD